MSHACSLVRSTVAVAAALLLGVAGAEFEEASTHCLKR